MSNKKILSKKHNTCEDKDYAEEFAECKLFTEDNKGKEHSNQGVGTGDRDYL